MLQTASALLLEALPTFIIVILLHFYLKATLYKPVDRVLAERHAATEGDRVKATEALRNAENKVVEYETKLREARGEIYREQETWRKQLVEQQNASLATAREENAKAIADAKRTIEAETSAARVTLASDAEALSEQIVATVRRTGKDVWYLLAKDEGHGFQKKQNRDLYNNATVLFFEKFL